MATTGSNFAKIATNTLSGTTNQVGATTPFLTTIQSQNAGNMEANTAGVVVDKLSFDPSITAIPAKGTQRAVSGSSGKHLGAYAKNGCIELALSGTTPQTIDLTNLAVNTPAGTAGDLVFATVNVLHFQVFGAGDVALTSPSNPSPLPKLAGTTPGITVHANSSHLYELAAGGTIDSTHKLIVCTPTATTTLCVTVGGA
jgi:hypothetical protein